VPDPLPIDEPFDPFASAPAVPSGEATDDEIDFDQFLSELGSAGFTYPGKNGEPTPIDPNAIDPGALPPDPATEGSADAQGQDPAPESDSQEPTVPTVRLGDKEVPLEEAQLLYELGKSIRDTGYTRPEPQAPAVDPAAATPPPQPVDQTPPPPAEPPEWIDTDDPVQMGMWSELQATRAEALAAKATAAQFVAQQQQTKVQQEVAAGVAMFKQQHPQLNDQEVQTLLTLAAPTVSAFVSTAANPVEGIAKAIRMAGMDFEPTRARVLGLEQKSGQQKSAERKSKLDSLNPKGSGSAPRTATPRSSPRTDRAATEEFAKELAHSFGTNGRLN
jgi:hypothetical protein